MMIELKPRCIVHTTANGDIRIFAKDNLSEEIVNYIAKEPFDKLSLSYGSWQDVGRLIPHKKKIKYLSVESDDVDWQSLSELSYVERLFIGGRYKCELDFSKLNRLKYLNTDWNDGYEKSLKNLNKLKSLVIRGYREVDFSTLESMEDLEFLEIVSTRSLSSLAAIQKFKNLRYVDIHNCGKLTSVQELVELPKLESLWLNKCKKSTDYSKLSGLKEIKELFIGGEMHDLQWIRSLKSLTKLRFNCKLEDGDLDFLNDMPNLKLIVFNDKRNLSVKLRDIQKRLEERGFDQVALRQERVSVADAYK
ncbi:hypothetical protein [Aliikangiella sp. IMCC44632]